VNESGGEGGKKGRVSIYTLMIAGRKEKSKISKRLSKSVRKIKRKAEIGLKRRDEKKEEEGGGGRKGGRNTRKQRRSALPKYWRSRKRGVLYQEAKVNRAHDIDHQGEPGLEKGDLLKRTSIKS